jgi:hypothetical protein
VLSELGSLTNPLSQQLHFGSRQWVAVSFRRHAEIRIVACDAFDQRTLIWLAGNDRRIATEICECSFGTVEAQIAFTLLFIRPMTREAAVREDGPNLFIEVDLFRRCVGCVNCF